MDHPDGSRIDTRYANTIRVGFNRDEFIIDLGQQFADGESFYWRIVCTPPHASSFLNVLREAVGNYESEYGAIPDLEEES